MCINPIYLEKINQFVQCRNCAQCRLARAKSWIPQLYKEFELNGGVFITLTYEINPINLNKQDYQKFLKRLRKKLDPIKVKYFLCGEYGDLSFRPHYHLLLFGYDFPDKKLNGRSKAGNDIYISDELSTLWDLGFHTIQDITVSSIVYTALYAQKDKKLLSGLTPEFNSMSRGLGFDLITDNIDEYLKTDEIWIEGKKYIIPDRILKKLYCSYDDNKRLVRSDMYDEIKKNRRDMYEKKYPSTVKTDMFVKASLRYIDESLITYRDDFRKKHDFAIDQFEKLKRLKALQSYKKGDKI